MSDQDVSPTLSRAAKGEAKEIADWCDEQAVRAATTANQQLLWVLFCLGVGLLLLLFLPRILQVIDYAGRDGSLPPKIMERAKDTSTDLIENLEQLQADLKVAQELVENKRIESEAAAKNFEAAKVTLEATFDEELSLWEELVPSHELGPMTKHTNDTVLAVGVGRHAAYPKVFTISTDDVVENDLPFLPPVFDAGGQVTRLNVGSGDTYFAMPNEEASIWTNTQDGWQRLWPKEEETLQGEISSIIRRSNGTLLATGWLNLGSGELALSSPLLLTSSDGATFERPVPWQDDLPRIGQVFSALEDQDGRLLAIGSRWLTEDTWNPSVPPGETAPVSTGSAVLAVFELLQEELLAIAPEITTLTSTSESYRLSQTVDGTYLVTRNPPRRLSRPEQFNVQVRQVLPPNNSTSLAERLKELQDALEDRRIELERSLVVQRAALGLRPVFRIQSSAAVHTSSDAANWSVSNIGVVHGQLTFDETQRPIVIGRILDDKGSIGERHLLSFDSSSNDWSELQAWPFSGALDLVRMSDRLLTKISGQTLLSATKDQRATALEEINAGGNVEDLVPTEATLTAIEAYVETKAIADAKAKELSDTLTASDRVSEAVKRQEASVAAFGDLRSRKELEAAALKASIDAAISTATFPKTIGTVEEENEPTTFARQLEDALRSAEPVRQLAQIATRLAVIALIVYLVQIFVNRYRYLLRLSGFYRARAQAMRVLAAQPKGDFLKGVTLNDLTDLLSPDSIGFDKSADPPTNQMISLLQAGLKKT